MGNVSREIELLRNNKKEKLETKNTGIEMKNAFDGLEISRLISELEMAKERISEFEGNDNRNIQNWKAKRKKTGKQQQQQE